MDSYDHAYSAPEFYWGQEPNGLCLDALSFLPPSCGRRMLAVDLGCGEGRDVIKFARHGLEAVGVDISAPGLRKAERWAAKEHLAIRTVQENLDRYRLTESFDLVYSSGTLTFLDPTLRDEAFTNYRAHTRVGCINAFNALVEKPFLETPPDWGRDEHFFRSGELLAHYWDWEILMSAEFIFDCTSGGSPHRHAMDTVIARRI